MVGYWPSSSFACLWTETKSRSINSQKKEKKIGQYPAILTEQILAFGEILGEFCLRDTAGSPERARWLHLARSGSQSQRAIWFILPARGTSHIITAVILLTRARCYATHYLSQIRINLLAFYHECRSLIGYATHVLFCDR